MVTFWSSGPAYDHRHILHEIHKATAGPLASKAGKFSKILKKLNTQRGGEIRRKEALIKKGKQDQARKVEREIERLDKELEQTEGELLKISNWKQTIASATSEISRNYHPYDLATGETKTLESLSEILEKEFATIKAVVKQMNISKKCLKRIEKAYKLVPQILTTLRFYGNNFDKILNEQSLALEVKNIVRGILAPAFYLEIAANKMQTAEKKNDILQVCKKLINELKG